MATSVKVKKTDLIKHIERKRDALIKNNTETETQFKGRLERVQKHQLKLLDEMRKAVEANKPWIPSSYFRGEWKQLRPHTPKDNYQVERELEIMQRDLELLAIADTDVINVTTTSNWARYF